MLVQGQQLVNGIDERPSIKFNFDDEDDNKNGTIILAAFRRRGGRRYGKINKVVQDIKVENKDPFLDVSQQTTSPPKILQDQIKKPLPTISRRITRPTKSVPHKKPLKVNVVDLEPYSVRRARYLFSQRTGK